MPAIPNQASRIPNPGLFRSRRGGDGRQSAEREVSLDSGATCSRRCARGVDAHAGRRYSGAARCAARRSLRACVQHPARQHGGGEDGVLQGALRVAARAVHRLAACSVPRCRWTRSAASWVWHALGLPTPHFVALREGDDVHAAAAKIGLPVIVQAGERRFQRRHHARVRAADLDAGGRSGVELSRRSSGRELDRGRRATPSRCSVARRCRRSASFPRVSSTTTTPSTSPRTRSTFAQACKEMPSAMQAWRCGVRRARLRRLGTRRCDARSRGPQLVARSEHRARHDESLAGAEGGGRGRHRFRDVVLADSGNEFPGRACAGEPPPRRLGPRDYARGAADRRRAQRLVRDRSLAGDELTVHAEFNHVSAGDPRRPSCRTWARASSRWISMTCDGGRRAAVGGIGGGAQALAGYDPAHRTSASRSRAGRAAG